MGRHQDYISEARKHNKAIWDGINGLIALQREWHAQDYATTLAVGIGLNEGITKAKVGSVVFDAANDIAVVMAGGVATNMSNLL